MKNIHISSHPADRYIFFGNLSSAISKLPSVNVTYADMPSDSSVDLPPNTDILVIVASEKYFTWQNSGYISEYIPAKERGIRILPIMTESHIVNLMNTRYGKTQYIDGSSDFSQAVRELVSLLSSDNFEKSGPSLPSLFVSYRKKDRTSLMKLLKAIDGHPGRPKFKVWYDGSILPGENYGSEISEAIDGCELFILLVTPSLLEEGNYVMTNEYPDAHKQKKRILPIETEKTDRALLKKYYPELQNPIKLSQTGALYSAITELISEKR